MSYIERSLSQHILQISKQFKVLLLTGPRQVGKTTLLRQLSGKKRHYISLDDLNNRFEAQNDPKNFIDKLQYPVLIDEVQYAPNLFSYIKMKVDQNKIPGQFWLTGSQQFAMMKNISDSLAGRVAILDLQGISMAEEQKRTQLGPFIPHLNNIKQRQSLAYSANINELYHTIWRGSFPDLVTQDGQNWQTFYASYLTSYIEKDVRDYLQIKNLMAFKKFMQVIASRTSQMLNQSNISKDLGINLQTLNSWLNVLQATGHVVLLQPYYNNFTKRAVRTPKIHFLDTGLCSYLTGWLTPNVLEKGAMSGPILESFVFSEIYKSFIHNAQKPPLYYYNDKDKNEVDVIVEYQNQLYPIEIKKSASTQNLNFKDFEFLTKTKQNIAQGSILSTSQNWHSIKNNNKDTNIIPIPWI